ncbi:MAG TPA: lysophospholipase [Feifaniaceae bacterium]|nr:lysophospholipase [Feifaniaceae bacterium]
MQTQEFRYASATGLGECFSMSWLPDARPRAIVQIAHGMAEHIGRYAPFAEYLCANGFAVVANDHAGHGQSADLSVKGYFGEQDGWASVVADMKKLHDHAAELMPGIPYILFGHSMGSFLARSYAARYPEDGSALILSGTAGKNPAAGVGALLAKREKRRNGDKKPSERLNTMSFASYNKPFLPSRTGFDWLSRDTEQVDRYVEDPLCGFVFTAEGFFDLLSGIREISSVSWAKKVPDVPIYIFSGEKDPVGNNGRGVKQVAGWLKDTGHAVTLKLYPEGRHEMLNEVNRTEVYEDVLRFLSGVV